MLSPIVVPISKSKLLTKLYGCGIFVVLGLIFVIVAFSFRHIAEIIFVFCGGLLSIGFFGTIGIFLFRKLSDNKPGIIIDENGITDNGSGVAAGFVPWSDVVNISTSAVMSSQFIMIHVSNPEFYINRNSGMKKRAMSMNYRMYGSPISLTNAGMEISFNDLNRFINDYYYRSRGS